MTILSTNQQEIAERIDAGTAADVWRDWKWQVRHAVTDISTFERLLGVSFEQDERQALEETVNRFPLRITPYYLSLIDAKDLWNDPIFMQCFPSPAELQVEPDDLADPLAEDADSPAPCITHRYPDRVLFLVSNVCAMYCRHCTRKRKVGDVDSIPSEAEVIESLDYIRENPGIRDVLLSGGDPFMLPDDYLDWILTELDDIEHVEVVRIGTRVPVVLPYRVTEDLVAMLARHHPLWVNTHFNHPAEITTSSQKALARLANAGIPLGNQTVLLAGVNDCPRIMKTLVQKLVRNRVRPYYLYQCDLSEGLTHFRTPVSKGIEIIENLIGHTSGFAVPTYVIDAPGGGGKIPVMPQYLISWATNRVVLRNFEGVITTYREPDSYEPVWCDRKCATCGQYLKLEGADESKAVGIVKLEGADESKAVGIVKLLSGEDPTTALVPENTERFERRNERADTVTTIGGTLVQHGRVSDRIYVMHLSPADLPGILDDLDALTQREGYTKIFTKVPASALPFFIARGYIVEARVPRFFRDREDAYFASKFFNAERRRESADTAAVLAAVRVKADERRPAVLPPGCTYSMATEDDADDLAVLYGDVFATYPFPIADAGYLRETMAGDYRYFIVRAADGRLAAASSVEIYREDENVEMTDFAVHPDFRGRNLSGYLLSRMEVEMRAAGMKTAFTIARALSYPINATFARAGYAWAGTLVNNTNICGGFESMNVWYRALDG